MNNILLATSSKKSEDAFLRLISETAEGSYVLPVSDGISARLRLRETEMDLVIVNTPLKDEQGVELAIHAADSEMKAVILVTNPGTYERKSAELEKKGIIVLKRPLEKNTVSCCIKNCLTLNHRINALKDVNKRLSDSIEEFKLVNRAKGMLMSQLRMTEAQAHRYIEKQAMDLRVSKKVISQNILRTYYNK